MPLCFLIWIANNYMNMHEDKGHLLVFGSKEDEATVNTSGSLVLGSDKEKLLGYHSTKH